MSQIRPARRAVVLAAGLSLALAPAALAHPGFDPPEAPVTGTVELTLQMAHGCGPDESADTLEVAVEPPRGVVEDVAPQEADGWELDVVLDDDRVVELTYRADGGAEPAPSFDLLLTTAGDDADVGDTLYWRVYQGCGDAGSYRWIGTPDQQADDPAVSLDLVVAEPGAGDGQTTTAATAEASPMPSPTPSPTGSPVPTAAATPAGEQDGSSPWPLLIGGLVLLGVLGAVVWSLVRQRSA